MKIRPAQPHRFTHNIIAASLMAASIPAFADVVISQLYGGGGNTGATLKNDFVELFNAGSAPVSLNGWSVQYASATGTSWQATPLGNATLQPGQYYLVQQAAGTGGSASLPTPDAIGTIAMSSANGKVALVNSTSALSGANPVGGATVVDLIGFGTTPNGYETAATGTALTNITSALRAGNGCTDTNNNAADFSVATPAPRNTATTFNVCAAVVNQPIVATCPAGSLAAGTAGSIALSASDADSRVNAASLGNGAPAGFTLGPLTAASADGEAATVALNVAGSVAAGNYAVVVNFGNDEAQTASCTVNVSISGTTPIHAIQGSGATSPLVGQNVTTQGVVTKVTNNGFFMQDEAPDSDETTSEGIFVYTSTAPAVLAGHRVRVAATVTEFAVGSGPDAVANPLTELTSPAVTVLATGIAIAPTTIAFPEVADGDLERYEGMLVHIDGPLTVAQNYFLGRYGQLTVAAGGRLEKPTNRHPAGSPEAIAMAAENTRRSILLDDGTSLQNPNPTPYLAADNTVRAGDTISGLTGVVDYGLATSSTSGLGSYRIQPTVAPAITRTNPRPAAPAANDSNIRVASFNVLNYFTTFTNGQTAGGQSGQGCTLGGATSAANCRGADNAAEFARQQAKIVSALKALNADVVGLMEIQNNGVVALQNLATALNAAYGSNVYSIVSNLNGSTGDDAIRVAMIYKASAVTPVGAAVSDNDPIHNRPPLAQTFSAANGERFSVVVNHFKSKSSCPTSGADADQGDGQGCWNARRVEQAQALRSFIQNLQTGSGDSDVIVIGDLNSYGKEDPILNFTTNGYVDQVARFDNFGYSYVFDGEAGYIDHALATPSLSAQITGTAHWRINADEPSIIDYNTEFKQPLCATCGPDYYTNTAYRSSDHDPVVIGLNLVKQIGGTAGRDNLIGTPGDDIITGGPGADTLTGGGGADQFVFTSLRDGVDTITDFQPGLDRIVLTQLLQSAALPNANPIADGYVTCKPSAGDAMIGIDTDGAGSTPTRNLVLLKNQACTVLVPGNFVF